jgi:hypothetical protein
MTVNEDLKNCAFSISTDFVEWSTNYFHYKQIFKTMTIENFLRDVLGIEDTKYITVQLSTWMEECLYAATTQELSV